MHVIPHVWWKFIRFRSRCVHSIMIIAPFIHLSIEYIHGWGTSQRREWILDELCNRFCTIFAKYFWHLAHAIRYLHALIQEGPYLCNYNVLYTLGRWYLTESNHKCSRMCLWRDVDMQRIIDEQEIVVTDYLRRRNRLLTNGWEFYNRYSLWHMT